MDEKMFRALVSVNFDTSPESILLEYGHFSFGLANMMSFVWAFIFCGTRLPASRDSWVRWTNFPQVVPSKISNLKKFLEMLNPTLGCWVGSAVNCHRCAPNLGFYCYNM